MENYCKVLDKFLTIVILSESIINNCLTFHEVVDNELINFFRKNCSDCESLADLAKMINETEIKYSQNSEI